MKNSLNCILYCFGFLLESEKKMQVLKYITKNKTKKVRKYAVISL